MTLLVNEIFRSIQGESSFAGWPCVMVRLSGCNLNCAYCDTRYASEPGIPMSIDGILAQIKAHECSLVELTGGEPLIQQESPALIRQLADLDYTVLLETNGSLDISGIDSRAIKIVDIKCPSSGEAQSNDMDNLARLQPHDEVKCVVGDLNDYRFAKGIAKRLQIDMGLMNTVHFSPIHGRIDSRQLAHWILADRLRVRLNLQLHKLIWDPDERGR